MRKLLMLACLLLPAFASTQTDVPAGGWHVAANSDFGGDGKTDVLWQTDSGALAIWEMDGTQIKTWDYVRIGDIQQGVPPGWHVAGTADFDGDGKNDILWRTDGGALAVWEMDGTHLKAWDYVRSGDVQLIVPSNWHVARLGDYDGDGKSDVLWQNADGSLPIWEIEGLPAHRGDPNRHAGRLAFDVNQEGSTSASG